MSRTRLTKNLNWKSHRWITRHQLTLMATEAPPRVYRFFKALLLTKREIMRLNRSFTVQDTKLRFRCINNLFGSIAKQIWQPFLFAKDTSSVETPWKLTLHGTQKFNSDYEIDFHITCRLMVHPAWIICLILNRENEPDAASRIIFHIHCRLWLVRARVIPRWLKFSCYTDRLLLAPRPRQGSLLKREKNWLIVSCNSLACIPFADVRPSADHLRRLDILCRYPCSS